METPRERQYLHRTMSFFVRATFISHMVPFNKIKLYTFPLLSGGCLVLGKTVRMSRGRDRRD